MDIEPIDFDDEPGQSVQLYFALAPILLGGSMVREFLCRRLF
jgi:hypothetical protein